MAMVGRLKLVGGASTHVAHWGGYDAEPKHRDSHISCFRMLKEQSSHLLIALIVFAFLGPATSDLAWAAQKDDHVFVFKTADEVPAERLQEAARALGNELDVRVVCGPLFSRYRLVMVGPTSDANQEQKAREALQRLLPGTKITSVPVSDQLEGELTIPTGQMIIQFRHDVTPDEINHTLGLFKLKVIDPPSNKTQGRYVVKDVDDDMDRLKKSQNALRESGRVEYATLDVLTALKH